MKNQQVRELTIMAVIAALYVALCYAFSFMSYGLIQFRVAEILLILAFYNKKYCIAVILGTFIANMLMFGPIDMILGTFATVLVLIVIILVKNGLLRKIIAAPAAAIINGVVISFMFYYFVPDVCEYALEIMPDFMSASSLLLFMFISVAIGEFAVVLLGVLVFAGIEKANPKIIDMLRLNKKTEEKKNQ